jgi:hypothetical protein
VRSSVRKATIVGANRLLGLVDLKLTRAGEHDWADPRTFLPFEETIRSAVRSNMTVGQYIDATYNVPGVNESTVAQLEELGVFNSRPARILELGPGSGRYLEQVAAICQPESYEIYETATPWASWLVKNYGVVLRPTDGRSLSATPTASVDLSHAHKVMCVLPFLTICRYLLELMRVTREGGYVVFDVPTEKCMPVEAVQEWADSDVDAGPYPSFLARHLVLDNFTSRGFELVGSFLTHMKPGMTEYFVFRRR